MTRHIPTILFACLLAGVFAAPPRAFAQTPATGKGAKTVGRVATGAADPMASARRATAVSLLTSLADKARDFRDGTLRTRAQARAADALWELDTELARTLFRRAWADALATDREIERKREEDRKAQLAARGSSFQGNAPQLRAEVLRLVGKRDRALTEEFFAELVKADREAAEKAEARPPLNGRAAPAERLRLGLAAKLLEEGDVERAVQFAEPALGAVTTQSVVFLSSLREKDAATADRLFGALLARAAVDPGSDANTVSLLSSYLFTPFTYLTSYRTGGLGLNSGKDDVTAPDVATALRSTFMRVAAQVLLRPSTPQEYDLTTAGREGTYLIIRRLLPLFDRYAPEATPALNARVSLLLPDVPQSRRSAETERMLAKGIVPEEPSARDEIGEALDRAASTPNVADRDDIYAALAVSATWRGDPRAQEIIDKIVDLDVLRRVRAFSDFSLVSTAIEKNKDADAALARARKGDLTPLQRAWALERAADIVARTDRAAAVSLLDEATAEARRIPDDDPGRARALTAVATRYEKLDRARAWDLMYEVAKAANGAPAFTGEDGEMSVQFRNKRGGWMTSFDVEEFNLAGVLTSLAAEDMNRAAQLAEGFTGEAARVSATVAVARSALVKRR